MSSCKLVDRVKYFLTLRDINLDFAKDKINYIARDLRKNRECLYVVDQSYNMVDVTKDSNSTIALASSLYDIENIRLLIHTHTVDDESLSQQDIETSIRFNIPICSYDIINHKWDYYDPRIKHPYPLKLKPTDNPLDVNWYLNQEYDYGRCDCMQVIEDYYYYILGISLKRSERKYWSDLEQRKAGQWYRFENELPLLGFKPINKPQKNGLVTISAKPGRPSYHIGLIHQVDGDRVTILHNAGSARHRYSQLTPLKRLKYISQFWKFVN